jgi:hypothetical protein
MQHKLILVSFLSLFSFAFTATGQKLVNSPFSRFNIGSMEPAGSFRSLAMGGIATSMRDNNSIYFSNPASYSCLDTNSFIFDFGIDYSINKIPSGISDYTSDDMNFDHLFMGFPLSKGWGFAVGIMPISNGYYKMSETVRLGDDGYNPLTGGYTSYHAGEGGFNNFFMGSGVRINKNFSVGVNMTIIFGEINRSNLFAFDDFYNVFHIDRSEKLKLGGINFDYGMQYTTSLKNDYFINAGVSLNTAKHYSSKYEQLKLSYTAYGSKDTISYISDNSTSAFIPGTLKLGISFGKKNKFITGFDFVSTNWSNSKIPGSTGYATNTKSLLWGAEFIPDKFSNYSYLKRVSYRIGAHTGGNYLTINGEQLKEYGASFGIGLPMRRSLSKTNLFFDFTKKSGSSANDLHTENYYTIGISLNLYDDFWFFKRKYE